MTSLIKDEVVRVAKEKEMFGDEFEEEKMYLLTGIKSFYNWDDPLTGERLKIYFENYYYFESLDVGIIGDDGYYREISIWPYINNYWKYWRLCAFELSN